MKNTASIQSTAGTYGVILGVFGIALLILTYVLNLQESNLYLSIASILITVFIYFYGIKNYKQDNNGFLKLGQALKVGLAIAAIGGLIGAIYAFVHYSFIYPEFQEIALETSKTAMMESQPNMSDEQMNQALEMSKMFTTPFWMATMSLIGTLFMGFIISLILGLVMKKDNPVH
ncbi:DUF4199 domain-containing protein [Haloflavibacter putidus]|uniref:DUF4199 domain-containing protein n=1 Tax=Haloflavibacter putidus TaxID=2576776 RepID=A0A507ZPH5_9FLAO|nr:DUF4199 domain-containing protein [Haloflavibacter putidus]TQD39470.1 DUF4199 domain-containing protein [Haloflavibacter putidus]